LRKKAGHPWTTLPDFMFSIGSAGYGGQGTLCGALGVAAAFSNLVTYDKEKTYVKLTDELFTWYSRTEFPTERFDEICKFPKQVKCLAKTPLCHVSVSQWSVAAGTKVTSKEKKDRCAKVTGEVVYQLVTALNRYADGTYRPASYPVREETAHCLSCHGSDDMWHEKAGMNNQQGKMDCAHCHPHHGG
jgi:hypothetical protein